MIYDNYSAPFFGGDYRVLRGGSWAVGAGAVRPSFRNWDLPIRRQIFSGAPPGLGRLMCRHLAWLGAPAHAGLARRSNREHGLLRQSYAPRRQRHGLMNADGWGVGLLDAGRPEPARWRSARPLWGDASFASVAPHVSAACDRSPPSGRRPSGMPLDESGCGAVHRRPLAAVAQRPASTAAVLPDAAWRAPSRSATARCSPRRVRWTAPDRVRRTRRRGRPAATRAPGSTCCSATASGSLATTWGDTLSLSSSSRTASSSPASRTTTTRAGATSPTAAWSSVTPDGVTRHRPGEA